MALEALSHIKGFCFVHKRHFFDVTVAGGARDSFLNVYAMVEINKIG
jgi:hypothetical protein